MGPLDFPSVCCTSKVVYFVPKIYWCQLQAFQIHNCHGTHGTCSNKTPDLQYFWEDFREFNRKNPKVEKGKLLESTKQEKIFLSMFFEWKNILTWHKHCQLQTYCHPHCSIHQYYLLDRVLDLIEYAYQSFLQGIE